MDKRAAKNFARTVIGKTGLTSRPHPFFLSNIPNIRYYLRSLKRDPALASGEVACLMCTWDEEQMIRYAIESSKDFASRYVVVDKDGSTVPKIKECRDEWNLDVEIHVKPELNLVQSWDYGIQRIDEPWILLQDGDEVFYTDGPASIHSLRDLMDRPDVVYCAPMVLLWGDLKHTYKNYTIMPPHTFLYQNNGTIRPSKDPRKDHPVMSGWKIGLPIPYKFNCHIKTRSIKIKMVPYYEEKYYSYPQVLREIVGK